ncbi:MAG TPA: tRNA threonylcarbamoyladenosine dehydratase [Bacteroidales bacterium]|nr:tRNA threonylcarbamoyladenosine dehydratase [Bacteroidales bacterium]
MDHWLSRTELLIGKENTDKLNRAHVLVAGLGGVGGYAAEQLCRAGIGEMTVIDGDVVTISNRNRQVIALESNEGKKKADLFSARLTDINPGIKLHVISEYLKEDKFEAIMDQPFDYVVDAIDTLTPKVFLIAAAVKKGHRVVSSMGSGGRIAPESVAIADISESHHCKFAYMVRKYLHRQGIFNGITVVYSPEPVSKKAIREVTGEENKRSVVGTISYMPPVFGCYCASVVIRNLIDLRF